LDYQQKRVYYRENFGNKTSEENMKRLAGLLVLVLLCLTFNLLSADQADLSGTWIQDVTKTKTSGGGMGGMGGPGMGGPGMGAPGMGGAPPTYKNRIIIQQTANEIKISTIMSINDAEQKPIDATYTLDGKEILELVKSPFGGDQQYKKITKAKLKSGKLEIKEKTEYPQGPQTSEKSFELSKDGKQLIIKYLTPGMFGISERKEVYNRQ
jgi:hypothetical protein